MQFAPQELLWSGNFWLHLLLFAGMIITFILLMVMFFIWYERRLIGRFQVRLGPNRAGPFGLLQPVADVLKILTKEDIVPSKGDKIVFWLAPIIALAPVFMMFAVIPLQGNALLVDLNIGILYIIAVSSVASIGIFMAGWGSYNKYSLIGAMRDVAQLISYEIPLVLSIVGVVLIAGSLSLNDIVEAQTVPFILLQPLGFLIFFIGSLAEINRTPFDLVEADSEIVAGYNIEYSGMKFATFFLMEYAEALTSSAIITTLFLGGWKGPFLPPFLWFIIKVIAVFSLIVWVRSTIPRFRIDQVMAFAWKFLLPLALINLLLTSMQVVFFQEASSLVIIISSLVIMAALILIWSKFFRLGGNSTGL
ncbi:MAG TPA: NADH-quinone oxidoreductase subunit NuoH [Dehalococcoidia bacterium]|nr:NADH-quinone oxidoreductase subunit NuoH [Dehalococcoidia bacterium]